MTEHRAQIQAAGRLLDDVEQLLALAGEPELLELVQRAKAKVRDRYFELREVKARD